MRRPDVPKDWLAPGFRWGVRLPGLRPEERWLDPEQMPGFGDASAATRTAWAAARRTSQIQDAICVEVNSRLPRMGYAHRTQLAWDPAEPDPERRTPMGRSTLGNILSGQRFITLREIALLESVLGGPLVSAVIGGIVDDRGSTTNELPRVPVRR